MITCYIRYVIEPSKLSDFESYAKSWIPLVNKYGGKHLGYFLPHESANNVALALFNFRSLKDYEEYRTKSMKDPECQKAYAFGESTKCIISYERSFMKPISLP